MSLTLSDPTLFTHKGDKDDLGRKRRCRTKVGAPVSVGVDIAAVAAGVARRVAVEGSEESGWPAGGTCVLLGGI